MDKGAAVRRDIGKGEARPSSRIGIGEGLKIGLQCLLRSVKNRPGGGDVVVAHSSTDRRAVVSERAIGKTEAGLKAQSRSIAQTSGRPACEFETTGVQGAPICRCIGRVWVVDTGCGTGIDISQLLYRKRARVPVLINQFSRQWDRRIEVAHQSIGGGQGGVILVTKTEIQVQVGGRLPFVLGIERISVGSGIVVSRDVFRLGLVRYADQEVRELLPGRRGTRSGVEEEIAIVAGWCGAAGLRVGDEVPDVGTET